VSPTSLCTISRDLAREVERLTFGPPVTHVYNPLVYARAPHERYLTRYGTAPKEVVLVGMNPGPFGMAQTGVPFGDPTLVRHFLGIEEPIGSPPRVHPKRPIDGFASTRSEVSGTRLWGWVRERFGRPEAFFDRFFVLNYCPLVFMEESGRNRTPDKLAPSEAAPLRSACDGALIRAIEHLRPDLVVGVGVFAERGARRVLEGRRVRVGGMLHPSPASPKANQGWAAHAERDLIGLGIRL